jgi:cellulose synthase/poly-beta-1,6-N-acetylglucosamine synthase-like glycosyltransferase
MDFLFYLTALLCGYSYFIYPLVLMVVPPRKSGITAHDGGDSQPVISLIITVHNEEDRIRAKLENSLDIVYPEGLLEIIVASDFSTDATDSIVGEFVSSGVRLVRADERRGKEYAQLCAIRSACGDILVFSDVATRIPDDALRILAGEFADDRVGALSSEDMFLSHNGEVVGEGLYVKYEMWLRRLESSRAGLVGLSGSFFAARREVCEEWDIYSPSDFNTALNCAKQGLVAVTCPEVVGIYQDIKDPEVEYHRKIRTVIRGITAIARHPEVLDPRRVGLFAFQVWSHKIMRWCVPWFMLGFAVLTVLMQGKGIIYSLALYAQVVFYAIAAAGLLSTRMRNFSPVRVVFFFVQTNLALAHAAVSYFSGKRMTVWTPSRR